MDNLKAQTYNVLTKLLNQMNSEQQIVNEDGLANPENQTVKKFKDFIDIYSQKLNAKDKMLLEVAYANELDEQINVEQFKNKISKSMAEISVDINEFNMPVADLNKNIMSKTKRMKKAGSTKKTQLSAFNVETHPEYYRVDHQICNKLFEYYKLLPLGLPKEGTFNFEQKEHHKNSINYHKVLQIFVDAGLNLDVNNKLLILRSIKKFCFNQNFINNQEFVKVFKVIVHGLGYKQQIFSEFIKKKQIDKMQKEEVKKNKGLSGRPPKRIYRFKTDNSILAYNTVNTSSIDNTVLNDRKQTSASKMGNSKVEKPSIKIIPHKQAATPSSYLVKAMESQKISKITWQSLFNMKQNSMHSYIVVPNIVRNVNFEEF